MPIAPPPPGGFRTDAGTYGTPGVTPGVPAPPPSSGTTGDPYGQYTSAITSDPAYLAWQANSQQTLSDAATQRAAAIKALVEQYGGMPTGFTDQYGDLSSGDLSLAASNPYSTEANLKRAYQTNVANMQKALAARGALHSGDLGYGQNQLDTQLGQDEYTAGQQFAQELQAAINAYTGAQASDRQAQAAAVAQAYQDIIGNPAYVPTAS